MEWLADIRRLVFFASGNDRATHCRLWIPCQHQSNIRVILITSGPVRISAPPIPIVNKILGHGFSNAIK